MPENEQAIEAPTIPAEFGGSWDNFARDWCLGTSLAYSSSDVGRALSTLKRLWPAEIERMVAEAHRGVGVVAPAVELGLVLNNCESMKAFPETLKRLVDGERSAYSELVVASALHGLGYAPKLAPEIGGRVLDVSCDVEGRIVYFEVVAPQQSEASKQEQQLASELGEKIRQRGAKARIEVEIREPIRQEDITNIIAAIEAAPASAWVEFGALVRARRVDQGQQLPPVFDGDGVQIVLGGQRRVQGDSTSVIVRWESSDSRAKRVFDGERDHFSAETANVLAVNVCAVLDGFKLWPTHMAKLLQPTHNRRVGAVAFFDQGCIGPPEAIRRRWRTLANSHAYVPIPENLLNGIESLDESALFGQPRAERLVASGGQ